jgi:hypothetical protein
MFYQPYLAWRKIPLAERFAHGWPPIYPSSTP